MEYLHLKSISIYNSSFLTSSKSCTAFTLFSQLHINLCKNLPRFFHSVILLQLLVSLCAISLIMNRHSSFKNYSLQLRVSLHFNNTSYFLISYIGGIFLFLHLSLCLLFSKFPIETMLNNSLIPTTIIYIHFSLLLLFHIPS